MTEQNIQNPEQLWGSLLDTEKEAVIYFAVSDWRTGVGKDYTSAMGMEDDVLNELVKKGVVETKPTWKMFQDEADKLTSEVQAIRDKMKDFTYRLEDSERETLSTSENFTRVASGKSEEPRYRIKDQKLHDYVRDQASE